MNQSLKKLRIILQSNYFYALLVLLSIVVVVASTRIIKYKSVYNITQKEFYGVVKSINIKKIISLSLYQVEKSCYVIIILKIKIK